MLANGLKPNLQNNNSRSPWWWIPSLYLAEGLPNAIVVTVAVVLLKNMGVDNVHVAFFTSLLYLPWVIKPFWAPFVDIIRTKRLWIVAMQLMLAVGMAVVAMSLSTPWFLTASLVAFWGVAFCSATHDIAADGFYMLALDKEPQAFFVGIRSTFYRLANLLASGGVVWLAGRMINRGVAVPAAWTVMFVAFAAFFLLVAIYHAFVLPRPSADVANPSRSASSILRDFGRTIATFFTKPHIWSALAFMLLYRLPEAILCKMVQPFLLDPTADGGLGLTTEQVGIANGTFGVIGIVIGGIVGGVCVARLGLRRCLWPMALMLTIPSGFYCYLAAVQPDDIMLISTGMLIEQFGYGFGFTAYMMYMMYFCEGISYATSHYAFCTGIMALGLMLPGMFAGHLQILAGGYPGFFALVMLLCIPTLLVCALIRRHLQ
jgi:PAT family beta-lactamase induction signal transducer AmpG